MKIANEISGMWLVIFLCALFNCYSAQMKWSSWSRFSPCTVTCGQGRQRRSRQCIKTQPTDTGTCPGPKEMYSPCQMLVCPEKKVLPCNCGCTLKEKSGRIISQLPSKETKSCEWRIIAKKGNTIALNVTRLVLKAGWVRIASGKKTYLTLLKPGPELTYPSQYRSEGDVMTVELLSYPDATGKLDYNTYLVATYVQIEKNPKTSSGNSKNVLEATSEAPKEPNVPAIIGITACVIVIILVAVFLAVRRHRNKEEQESENGNEAVSLNNEFEAQGKLQNNGIKEEKPLMDGKGSPQLGRQDRYYPPQQQIMVRPNFVQGRGSSCDSSNYSLQNQQLNGQRRVNYPPELYVKAPNYIPDPNFVRMVPVTTSGIMLPTPQPQQAQPYMMRVPQPPRSDHS